MLTQNRHSGQLISNTRHTMSATVWGRKDNGGINLIIPKFITQSLQMIMACVAYFSTVTS